MSSHKTEGGVQDEGGDESCQCWLYSADFISVFTYLDDVIVSSSF